MKAVLSSAVLGFLLTVTSPYAGEFELLDWGRLIDPCARDFEDPYRDLAPEELVDLVTLGRLRERLRGGEVAEDVRSQLEEQITDKETTLVAAGIDVDWLISQRWVVAERRERAAKDSNTALDGTDATLAGFLIPAPALEDGTLTAYLVRSRWMNAHMPPPPPNQLLHLVMTELSEEPGYYTPVVARGRLMLQETRREVFLVDGNVTMWSSWTLQTDSIEDYGR
ncbi:MAG: DUF3299 domain-containing protein [bacterium]|nr:DUF3299 domain-containing protein [bacterium]